MGDTSSEFYRGSPSTPVVVVVVVVVGHTAILQKYSVAFVLVFEKREFHGGYNVMGERGLCRCVRTHDRPSSYRFTILGEVARHSGRNSGVAFRYSKNNTLEDASEPHLRNTVCASSNSRSTFTMVFTINTWQGRVPPAQQR